LQGIRSPASAVDSYWIDKPTPLLTLGRASTRATLQIERPPKPQRALGYLVREA